MNQLGLLPRATDNLRVTYARLNKEDLRIDLFLFLYLLALKWIFQSVMYRNHRCLKREEGRRKLHSSFFLINFSMISTLFWNLRGIANTSTMNRLKLLVHNNHVLVLAVLGLWLMKVSLFHLDYS